MPNFPFWFWRLGAFLIMLGRIVVPVFVYLDPFIIPIILAILDFFDYMFLMNARLLTLNNYLLLDKIFDFYYLTAMFIISLSWQVPLLTALYIYRLLGFVLVIVSKNRKLFFIFPNLFEYHYLIYAYAFTRDQAVFTFMQNNMFLVFVLILAFKLYVEYSIHVTNDEAMFFRYRIFKRSKWAESERKKAQAANKK